MPKPPVVWHLDTEEINDFTYSPKDRLTLVKEVMTAFNESNGCNLQATLNEIDTICKIETPEQYQKYLTEKGLE